MSATAPVLTRSWKVGRRTCTLSIPRPNKGQTVHCVFEWEPSVPKRLTAGEWQQYRAGRDAALAELAVQLGLVVGLVEL